MSFTDTAVFGLELIAIGLALVLAIVVLRLIIRRVQPFRRTETSQALFSSKIPPNSDAVLSTSIGLVEYKRFMASLTSAEILEGMSLFGIFKE